MNSHVCTKCGKAVYFAERKTSLGKQWHRACLRCEDCQRVLNPGQHAEHKGTPFCNPCYQQLFGPQMVGYGSNVVTAATYNRLSTFKTGSLDNISSSEPLTHSHLYHIDNKESNNNIVRFASQTLPASLLVHRVAKSNINNNDYTMTEMDKRRLELQSQVDAYNERLRGNHGQLTVEENDKRILIEGPLRIYWGVELPVQLKQCDDISVNTPFIQATNTWRHSCFPSTPTKLEHHQQQQQPNDFSPKSKVVFQFETASPTRLHPPHGLDDSMIPSPGEHTTEVVRRRNPGIRKFNTVAYRGDQGNRWRRASINGHVYNYDTRVFVPVVGSCTSVRVTSHMSTPIVIKALLDKFKIENKPDEYSLYIVPDKGDEQLLSDSDLPLLERLSLGADETVGKLFLKEKVPPDFPIEAWTTLTPEDLPGTLQGSLKKEVTPVEFFTENLPHEVEQLLMLPDAVLHGLLKKFIDDEEKEVIILKQRYERSRVILQRQLDKLDHRMRQSQA